MLGVTEEAPSEQLPASDADKGEKRPVLAEIKQDMMEGEDSDDDEPIIRKPRRKNFNASLIEDSDEEDNNSNAEPKEVPEVQPKPRARIVSDDDDDEEPEDTEDKENAPPPLPKEREPIQMDDIFDTEMSDEEDKKESEDASAKNKQEAESSDDEGVVNSDEEGDAQARHSDQGEEEDEDGHPKEMSAALKRRLKQGAGKKPKKSSSSSGKSRSSKDDRTAIHSESQRIVREAEVKMPYRKPTGLKLSEILGRTQQKQAQLQTVLKQSPNCTWKTAPGLAIQPRLTPKPEQDITPREKRSRKQKRKIPTATLR